MGRVAYLDNNKLNKPATRTSKVYTVSDDASPLTKEQLIQRHPNVFGEGVGRLEGDYCIRLDSQMDPVQHAPRRVPVALRDRFRQR